MSQPKLDRPGAGLPFPQSLFVPFIVRRISRRASWEDSRRAFERLSEKILGLVDGLDARALETQVLVPRLRGLEDSSRYWSVAMTLEHLVIVSEGMVDIIVALSRGETPALVVDTGKVKPQGNMDAETAKREFKAMGARVTERLDREVVDRASTATHRHPWFGPFDARQWHWLLGAHASIHREQIKHILKGLEAGS